MSSIEEVVIVSAVRSAVGRYGGALKDMPIEKLGAAVIREAVERSTISADSVHSVVVGNVLRTQPEDAYLARICAREAGLPIETHAVTVNRLCGSGLEAIINAAQQIQLGESQVAVAGGVETMSRVSYSSRAPRFGARMGPITLDDDMLAALHDPFGAGHMGDTAEHVADQFGIGRADQDAHAAESQRRAANAIKNGYFKDQILPLTVGSKRKPQVFDTDEHPRDGVNEHTLATMNPAFKRQGGSVTAGNASGINDGASALVVTSASWAKDNNVSPMARLVAYARTGVDPSIMGIGPVSAVRLALKRAGLSVNDLDVIESNEAFSAQACAVAQELNFPPEKTNPNGGAIALGHPVGATGAIITTKCLYELHRTQGRYGLVTLCIGGGQGIAAVFEATPSSRSGS